ncbi:MAG: GNAT family N-acetyltransferase, partial [Rubrimonas sp.]
AGFIMLDHRGGPSCDIAYFGMAPEAIGRGLGDWLLGTGIHMAWDEGATKLTVNTCTLDHPRALGLYQKWGFVPIRREQRRRVIGRRG